MSLTTLYADQRLANDTDHGLIQQTLLGDHSAFTELVRRHHQRLFASMIRVTGSAETAEEVVQEAFVQAYLKLDTFREEATFSTWLFRIAFNKYLGHQRTANRHRVETLGGSKQAEPTDDHDSPEKQCVRSEERQQVRSALDRLDAKSRDILVLREMNGLSYDEISHVLKLKLGTVRSQLSRAREKLQRELRRSRVLEEI